MVGYFGIGAGEGKKYKYEDLAEEGYMKNAIVYKCVNEISVKELPQFHIMLKAGDQVIEDHIRHYRLLMDRPNPLCNLITEFFNSLISVILHA